MMDFCSYLFIKSSNRIFTFVILYGAFKTISDTYKPSTRHSTDPEMAIKSLTKGNFEHLWYILTKISTCGSPICPFKATIC